jgi:RNA polymerase sigma factor (sigma-70 family)
MTSTSGNAVAHVVNSETSEAEDSFVRIYESYFGLLTSIAVHKFRVPETDAETLVHEVFLNYLRRPTMAIIDLRGWLIGATCHISRHYWRLNGRMVSIQDDLEFDRDVPTSTRILDTLPDQIAARQRNEFSGGALECLSPRCQEVLRLRYFEGWSDHEIAEHLGVKPKYASNLVSKCLRRAQVMADARDVTESVASVEYEQAREADSLSEALEDFGKAYREVM